MIDNPQPAGATPLNPDDLEGLRCKHITTREELNELEQKNITECLQKLPRICKRDILSEPSLLKLHEMLFGKVWEWAGQYRRTEKNIGVSPAHIPEELRKLIDDAKYWAKKKTYCAPESAARFHHRLVEIHPFADGNGRHARVATDLYLEQYLDRPLVKWTYEPNVGEGRRLAYISALQEADKGDYRPLLEFMEDGKT